MSLINNNIRKQIRQNIKTFLLHLDPTLPEETVSFKTIVIEQKLYTQALFYEPSSSYYQCLDTLPSRIGKVLSEFEVSERLTERMYL
jgi:hypothetical protein